MAAQNSTAADPKVQVKLSVPYKCAYGEVIKVVGNAPELGNWNADAARAFSWTDDNVWVRDLQLPPGTYEFKVRPRLSGWICGLGRFGGWFVEVLTESLTL